MKRRSSLNPRKERLVSLGAVVLVLVLNFYPSFAVYGVCSYSSPFSTYKDAMANLNNGVTFNAYEPEEREFVRKCGEVVPEGDLVANFPYDGSSMAYGIDGLSVVFRTYLDFSYEGNPELLKRIDDALWDSEVREFLQRNNIQYLLLLDCYQDVDNESFAFFDHENEEGRRAQWEGILSVEDGTPGFEVVLSEGDMRLYKIVY